MNRRDFLSVSAAACILPALPAIPDLRPVRVYSFGPGGNEEFVAARSIAEAEGHLRSQFGHGYVDEMIDGDPPYELSSEDMGVLMYRDDDGNDRRTFAEQFVIDMARGLKAPFCFASANV